MKKIRLIAAVMMALLFAFPLSAAKKGDKSKGKSVPATASLNRGRGLRITVPSPNASGLGDADSWAVQVIQDLMTTGFSTYTDMTVIDRSNEALVIEEQKRSEKGTYSDTDYLEMGKITQAQYLLVGKLTNAGGVYRLALNINDGTTNEIKASFNESVSLNDIQNGNATNQALLKLIPAMNFELTSEEINRLNAKATTAKSTDARTESTVNLAKGMAAEKNQNTVEALAYYASSMTKEAAIRYDNISLAVSTGNIREDIKNDIAARNAWLKMYADLQSYINKNAITFNYDVRPGEYETDYRNNTVTIPFTYFYEVNPTAIDVYTQIEKGLQATGNKKKWSVDYDDFDINAPTYIVYFELKNDSGKLLGTTAVELRDGVVSTAINRAREDIANNREAEMKTTSAGSAKMRFTHSSGRSYNNDKVVKHAVEFSKIPYTEITDNLKFGISKIEVYQNNRYSYYSRNNKPDFINPPIDITILGAEEAAKSANKASFRTIEAAAEPAEWGSYKKGDRGPAGGVVFEQDKKGYTINGKTYHYLEVSPLIQDYSGNVGKKLISLVSTSGHTIKKIGNAKVSQKIGGGLEATNMLIEAAAAAGYSDVVSLIAGYSYGGYNDWYIPNDDEIDSIGYWLDWSGSSSRSVANRDNLAYLFTFEGAISLRESAYQGSQYTTFNVADFKGYYDIPKADCILFIRAF